MSEPLPAPAASNTFERIKRVNQAGAEFWSARELARVLEYREFRNLSAAISKAREACTHSGHVVTDHFVLFNEMVGIGSGAQRELEDWALSRYACYLVIQNADPSKPLVALGQTYFAIQTRRQELADAEALQENQKRLLLRAEMKTRNKKLAGVAKQSGVVQPLDYAIFMDLRQKDRPVQGPKDNAAIVWAKRHCFRDKLGIETQRNGRFGLFRIVHCAENPLPVLVAGRQT